MNPVGQIQDFSSRVDNTLHPYAVCATNTSEEPKPLVLEVSPGAITDLAGAIRTTERIVDIAARNGRPCVALRPTGCGPGSVYQNYGEVDLLESIEHVSSLYAIDRDKISIAGSSMGGAATWYLASHYPDLFAAAVPFAGYCDYRLWEKPGGLTFQMSEWEEPSWRSRSAALLVENLQHTPIWIGHGSWDRSIGGGVSVEHSRQMARLMGEIGHPYKYTEVPELGHTSADRAGIWEDVVLWLLDQRKMRDPEHVTLASYGLRHNRSYWVSIDQLARYGHKGTVDARLVDRETVNVTTEDVRAFSLGSVGVVTALPVTVDGQDVGTVDITGRWTFSRAEGDMWLLDQPQDPAEKRHGSSGPIGDMFFDRTILVPGTSGSRRATHFNDWATRNAQTGFRSRNSGVHRGGILGENSVDLAIIADSAITEGDLVDNLLLLYGTHSSNSVLARFESELPLAFDGTAIQVSDKSYKAERAAVFAIFPHPRNPERYVAVHGGVTPDAVSWGSHLGMQLLPDYLVYSRGEALDWGFWGDNWRRQT